MLKREILQVKKVYFAAPQTSCCRGLCCVHGDFLAGCYTTNRFASSDSIGHALISSLEISTDKQMVICRFGTTNPG